MRALTLIGSAMGLVAASGAVAQPSKPIRAALVISMSDAARGTGNPIGPVDGKPTPSTSEASPPTAGFRVHDLSRRWVEYQMASAFTHLPGVAAGASEDSFAPVELIGLWPLDEFLAMVIPFVWGIMTQHILIGMAAAFAGWWGLKKAKAGRAASWLLHLAYWHLPAGFTGLRATPPSYLRLMAG